MPPQYTIYLRDSQLHMFDTLDIYNYMNDDSTPSVFPYAGHSLFKYYLKRTPYVENFSSPRAVNKFSGNEDGVLCIVLGGGNITTAFKNLFLSKSKKILYLENIPATLDLESTWKTIQTKRDLKTYKKIVFDFDHHAKLMYAYRASKSYGLLVEDITT